MNKLFVYGTLVGRYENAKTALLKGAKKVGLCITPAEKYEVKGELIEVDDDELKKLDAYEGTPENYKRVEIVEGVEAYIGNPEHRRVEHDYDNLEEEFSKTSLVIKD